MLCKKNYSHLFSNGVFLQSIILLVMISPRSVSGEENKTFECFCEDYKLDLVNKRQVRISQGNCDGSTSVPCSTEWCFKAEMDVTKPDKVKGKYKQKGCTTKPTTTDSTDCKTENLKESGIVATVKTCYCSTDMCNYDIDGANSLEKFTGIGLLSSSIIITILCPFLELLSPPPSVN